MSSKWYVRGLPKGCDRWVNLILRETKDEAHQALKRVRKQERSLEDEYMIVLHDFSALKVEEFHEIRHVDWDAYRTNPYFPPKFPTITS